MPPADQQPDSPDIRLSDDDSRRLQEELARIYDTPDSVLLFLNQIGFPVERIPIFRPEERESFWSKVFTELDRGVIATPYRRMLAAALRRRDSYRALADLADRYEVSVSPRPGETEAAAFSQAALVTCRVIVRTSSPSERDKARTWLAGQGFAPVPVWSTQEDVSFELNQTDPAVVRERLRQRPDVRWTLVPPGEPDYVIPEIVIGDPDGRELRVSDVPAQYKLRELADILVRRFPGEHLNAPMLGAISVGWGRGRRANPNRTLAEEGVGEDSRILVNTLRPGPLKVFLFGASPKDRDPVRAENEAKAIAAAARLGHLELRECQATQTTDLPEIRRFQPDILHFSCHSEVGNLLFEDEVGLAVPVRATNLARMLGYHAKNGTLKLLGIVLASCDGEHIAPAFHGIAETVVAHKKKLDSNCSLLFTRYFYEELHYTPELDNAAWTAAYDVLPADGGCETIVDNLIVRSTRTRGGG